MPTGGPVDTQPVPPNQIPVQLQALIDAMTPVAAKFRNASGEEFVQLDKMNPALGDSPQIRIASVGLGYCIDSHHSVTFTLTNTSGSTQTVKISPHAPYNLITGHKVAINGGETVHSASGLADLLVAERRSRATLLMPLSSALCRVTIGSNLTPTASTQTLSGFSSISIPNAVATNNTITFDFYCHIKLAYNETSLVGALPLQNRQVYATYEVDTAATVLATGANAATDQTKCFYNASAGTVGVAMTSWAVTNEYGFWSIPQNNPALYQPLITNSYQVMEQRSLGLVASGPGALSYSIPQNVYLVALHLLAADSAGGLAPFGTFTKAVLGYNAGVINPVSQLLDIHRARQYRTYGHDPQGIPGYTLWDGDAVAEDINNTDDSGWIDAYDANSPTYALDVSSGLSLPATYSVTREAIVPGSVAVVGG